MHHEYANYHLYVLGFSDTFKYLSPSLYLLDGLVKIFVIVGIVIAYLIIESNKIVLNALLHIKFTK